MGFQEPRGRFNRLPLQQLLAVQRVQLSRYLRQKPVLPRGARQGGGSASPSGTSDKPPSHHHGTRRVLGRPLRAAILASASRPTSVIVSRSMLSVQPPAFTTSGFATASPARTILASSLTVDPCAW